MNPVVLRMTVHPFLRIRLFNESLYPNNVNAVFFSLLFSNEKKNAGIFFSVLPRNICRICLGKWSAYIRELTSKNDGGFQDDWLGTGGWVATLGFWKEGADVITWGTVDFFKKKITNLHIVTNIADLAKYSSCSCSIQPLTPILTSS